jgi:hypothetical protein
MGRGFIICIKLHTFLGRSNQRGYKLIWAKHVTWVGEIKNNTKPQPKEEISWRPIRRYSTLDKITFQEIGLAGLCVSECGPTAGICELKKNAIFTEAGMKTHQ